MNCQEILSSTGKTYDLVYRGQSVPLMELRHRFFTSTNFPKLIGIHPHTSKHQLYLAKTGSNVPRKLNANRMRGIRNEKVAIDLLQKQLGQRVFQLTGWHRHPNFKTFLASPDGVCADGALVEVKCPKNKNHEIPPHHEAQMRWDMWCLNARKMYYVQMVKGDIHVDILYRDDKLVLDNLSLCLSFIDIVKSVNEQC